MGRNLSRKRNVHNEDASRPGKAKRRAMHPSNKYAENPPDFSHLASLYPSFSEFVAYGPNKKPRIDWTDFNATRELTRVLLDHDFGIKWWVPDGQLCPTVPNRANYIHWIDDLLSLCPAPWHSEKDSQNAKIRGVDIGTGANCIYPLLGAALHGWHFVGTDITPVALHWARTNVEQNPQYGEHIEIRNASIHEEGIDLSNDKTTRDKSVITVDACTKLEREAANEVNEKIQPSNVSHGLETVPDNGTIESSLPSMSLDGCDAQKTEPSLAEVLDQNQISLPTVNTVQNAGVIGPSPRPEDIHDVPQLAPVLCGVLKDGERFDFCMCNPPFFETIEEAGLNPRTACGGTSHEMVCSGGELAFITQIIEDSVQLGTRIQWYTSMVGRKVNLNAITSRLRAVGVTMLRTTEFVQGRTSRWGIAWSFAPVQQNVVLPRRISGSNKVSFMLEGINRQVSATDVLQELSKQLQAYGATNAVNIQSFSLSGELPIHLEEQQGRFDVPSATKLEDEVNDTNKSRRIPFQASVLQQVPGTLVIKASLMKGEGPSGIFSSLFDRVEAGLKEHFVKIARR
ncbi:U6 snRNA m6A methyltransferase [Marchantia polymorpha subsp. ruderalis]|uniref:U6 small nuclear RNA (adenine-(43)-N(6))-methyltransferase n=2 Tax=Marchantia polymorpha TaxID=3197 RepID=A0AAF6AZ77_MARPO|nr:hypothetical protein MARPO_0085s0033 [Marchantia polymorpha]PTQ33813.1 hypothetical protein MARPO_0085s0033 [Marchantia polymorpha]BBN05061.1 hypothetical protein Mp_3g09940 [Marchantia polymorpha subsp. ruderalis]BBN05062.1 hypothetical protein Mp_3g09940 [Marchantia polymorpha subsp. ruderalis]|eukprot:PTQ33812.1 hypothetical protein MARPO_0085s0033 [Marchantia polymorpha]